MVKNRKKVKTPENMFTYPVSASTGVITAGKGKMVKLADITASLASLAADGQTVLFRKYIYDLFAECINTQEARINLYLVAAQSGATFTDTEFTWGVNVRSNLDVCLDKPFAFTLLKAIKSIKGFGTTMVAAEYTDSKTVSINLTKQANDMIKVIENDIPTTNPAFFLIAEIVPFSTASVSVLGFQTVAYDLPTRVFAL